jgi:hypothetical protein
MFDGMDRGWRVVLRGPVDPAKLDSLNSDQILYVSGHSGRGVQSKSFFVMAPTAAAAGQRLQRALETDAIVSAATPLPFVVAIGVPEEEADAIDEALGDPWARHLTALIEREPADGLAEFLLEAVAESAEDAVVQVSENYQSLRKPAGLPPSEVEVLFVNSPWVGTEPLRHRAQLDRAKTLLDAGQPDFAVVIAQVAFETLVRQAVIDELDARDLGRLRSQIKFWSYSLAEMRQRRLWNDLMDDEIGRSEAWERYMGHVTRRNLVVHEGEPVELAQASESFEAVGAMIEHVEISAAAEGPAASSSRSPFRRGSPDVGVRTSGEQLSNALHLRRLGGSP